MNCDTARHQLLASERPAQPAGEVQAHLARCPSCRALQRRIIQVEQRVPLLPVPPSAGCRAVVAAVLQAPAPAGRAAPAGGPERSSNGRAARGQGPGVRESVRRKVALAFALAAGLAVFALAWWAWPHPSPTKPNPLLAELQARRAQRLEAAATPRARAQAIAGLADEVLVEAMTADAQHLPHLADFYGQLVRDDLPEHAESLPTAERLAVFKDVPEQLVRHESTARRRAAAVQGTPRSASFHAMAEAAFDGTKRLRWLLAQARA